MRQRMRGCYARDATRRARYDAGESRHAARLTTRYTALRGITRATTI